MSYQSGVGLLREDDDPRLLRPSFGSDDLPLSPSMEEPDHNLEKKAALEEYLRETALPPENESEEKKINKKLVSIGYLAAMGVCGIVLVALGSTLDGLASNIGVTSTSLGTVFIARGVGAIIGAIVSAKLYVWFQGNHVVATSLLFIFALLCIMPYNTTVVGIHILFLFLGLNTAITDTGCQIMTRKLHGKTAGPWLGANTVAFGISGALVPLIEIFTDSLVIQYYSMALIVISVSAWLGLGPNPESEGRLKGPPKREAPKVIHYHAEIVIAIMVFCFIGGKVTATAYLDTYVDATNVIDTSNEAKLVLVLWVAITIGRLAGVQDQRFLTNKTLPAHLSILGIGGFLSMLLILWFPDNGDCLWIGVAFYGLFNGPCVGYCYDWNNRITFPTETSMSIVMFGLNFGASLVPYITTLIWDNGGGPKTLIVVIFLSMFIPMPLLHVSKYLSYDPSINPWLKPAYLDNPDESTPMLPDKL
jgi:predicted MFS family arabinose efflux permease